MLKKLHTRHVQGQRTNGPSAGLCCPITLSILVGKRCKKLSFQSFPKVVWKGPQGLKIRRWMLAKRVRSTCKAANQEKAARAEQNDPLKGAKELRRRDKHSEPPKILLLQRERGTKPKLSSTVQCLMNLCRAIHRITTVCQIKWCEVLRQKPGVFVEVLHIKGCWLPFVVYPCTLYFFPMSQ